MEGSGLSTLRRERRPRRSTVRSGPKERQSHSELVPAGTPPERYDFKVGAEVFRRGRGDKQQRRRAAGGYFLTYRSGVPFQVSAYNTEVFRSHASTI